MKNVASNINWQKSPAHMDLLSKFIKPRDVVQVLNWQYLKETIKEKPSDAIERFIQNGVLVAGSLEDTLESALKVPQLEKMLKERGLKQKGTKNELIERLIVADRPSMEELVRRLSVMKCSENGLKLVKEYERAKEQAMDEAKKITHKALLANKPKDAYKEFISFQREYVDPRYQSGDYEIEQMEFVLSSHPKIFGEIASENIKILRAAVCMAILWREDLAINWLPVDFQVPHKSNEVAANYLKQNAKIRAELARIKEYSKKARIAFRSGDVDSCELCFALNNNIIDIKNFPELPFEGCTSSTGCLCDIQYVYEEEKDVELKFEEAEFEEQLEPLAKVGEYEGDEIIDFEMTGIENNLSARSGIILKFADGSQFEFYYEYPIRRTVENYGNKNAAKRLFEEIEDLTSKLKWKPRE